MTYIGIDFSLNSPGVCIFENNEYKFISFFNYPRNFNDDSKILKSHLLHKELIENNSIIGVPYIRNVGNKDFIIREREKIADGLIISKLIINTIKEHCIIKDAIVGLEGFSYGSKGKSFIDIIQYNTFLRRELFVKFKKNNVFIIQPSKVKQLAGKGNANKKYLFNTFKENFLNDKYLQQTKLWKFVSTLVVDEHVPKPLDDLIDSYYLVKSIINIHQN